ncbi:DUF4129 domain-containing protein [Robiginitalea sp. M366]|uniref:DUF4129 domain-containing protein n=1 Tax=Robiginitalea aestuariiviva TaxID=3036903 RepID=UPI00240E4B50|nr:DUF4129 domain-containing protein [Robiginitalea aestuariiviva]MDG1572569.1 DUF4129 domain-containing protein [Robiginitalea aestuariiviva]
MIPVSDPISIPRQAGAQVSDSVREVAADTLGPGQVRSFEPGLNERYSGSDFDYLRPEGAAENYLARFINAVSRWLFDTFGVELPPGWAAVLEYVIYILLGALAIYLVVRYLIQAPFGQLFRKEAEAPQKAIWTEEALETTDLDALLETALAAGDYRMAVRYRYLRLLQQLQRAGRIAYHPEKTNWDYLSEISDAGLRHSFAQASRIYEYTWYGEQALNPEGYGSVAHLFETPNTPALDAKKQ